MKKGVFVILTLIMLSSCRDSIPFDTSMATSSLAPQSPLIAQYEPEQVAEEDCMFMQNTHAEVLDEYAHIGEVIWKEEENIAQITLPNKEIIKVRKEGCDYLSFDVYWNLDKDTQDLESVNFWLEKTKWLVGHFFQNADQKLFEKNIRDENYHFNSDKNSLNLTFTNHQYEEWYIKVNKVGQKIVLSTGYYYN